MAAYLKTTWVVHAIAECTVCGVRYENYKNAQALAAKHAKQTGHVVTGEVGLAFEYPRKLATGDKAND